MEITPEFLESVGGPKTFFARTAMLQAGKKRLVRGLREFLISSVGACEITFEQAKELNLPIRLKRYSFLAFPFVFTFVPSAVFRTLPQIVGHIDLDVAMARNGLIGLRDPSQRFNNSMGVTYEYSS